MQDEKMCLWVGQRICKFSSMHDMNYSKTFKKEYCDFCLRGQEVVTLMNILNKLDSLLISQKK